jgi:hypothetical protein
MIARIPWQILMRLSDLSDWQRIRRHGRDLVPAHVRSKSIASAWCIAVCCVRNEMMRIPKFLAHYRQLGVEHFLFVDNDSVDGLSHYLEQQPDCSHWRVSSSYKAANFGMDWCNTLLDQYGPGKWCLTADPDEFLVYPYSEDRGLLSLTRQLEAIEQDSLLAVMIDAYSDKSISQTPLDSTTDPFDLCPYFDRFNLTQSFNPDHHNFWIQGGCRARVLFAHSPSRSPALNKVPLVRWRKGLRYISSMHHLNDPKLNGDLRTRPEAVSGALFHFKYVNLLQGKAKEELVRGEHYDASFEYKAYAEADDLILFDANVSLRYEGTSQLSRLGFIQAGLWF